MKSVDSLIARPRNWREVATQRGLSLIELIVAMAIGLFLVAVIGVLFLNSKMIYLSQDANSRIQENSRYVMELLGRQLRMVGAPDIKFTQLTEDNLFAAPPAFSFKDKFPGKEPITATNNDGAPDELIVSFDSTKNCLGEIVAAPVVNSFKVNAKNQLTCNDDADKNVLLDDVEDLQVLYEQPTAGGYSYLTATDATMATVIAARVCVLLRAQADTNKRANGAQSQTYVDCMGHKQSSNDKYLRRAVSMTVNLRNRTN